MTNVPKIRFPGFTEPWEQRKFSELVVTRRGLTYSPNDIRDNGVRVLRSSNIDEDRFSINDDDVFVRATAVNIPTVCNGDILITSANGSSRLVGKHAIIDGIPDNSAVHGGFMLAGSARNPYFANALMSSSWYQKFISIFVAGGNGAIGNLNKNDLDEQLIMVPPEEEEQDMIGYYFRTLDNLITLHQHKLDDLEEMKKGLLQKMFPAEGSNAPEIRFPGFTNPWEQRKLGEVVTIERGGSPRPIDAYITDASDGLNWVKIGDAPEQGRYINHTEEKIKPSGLSKTRQVFPGDLILSNSMSFGKPYIMGIPGCIHDGWLLIRNSQNVFDLKFLCYMLGTDQMLKQYKSLAAGSTVNNLNKELVSNAVVSVPNKPEQERIGAFLESIDDVITLHQRKLDDLKELKKGLLQQMFVE